MTKEPTANTRGKKTERVKNGCGRLHERLASDGVQLRSTKSLHFSMEALLGGGTFKFRLNAYLTSHITPLLLSWRCQLFVEFSGLQRIEPERMF
jgi:hypothetical protein